MGKTRNSLKDICLSSFLLVHGEDVGRRQGAGCTVVIVRPGPASVTLTKLLGEVSQQEMLLRLFSVKVSFRAWLDGWTVSRQEKESQGKGSVGVARGSLWRPGAQAVS